jgi:hypothetical protein
MEKIDWQSARERIPNDYGEPQSSNGPEKWQGFDKNTLEGGLASAELAEYEHFMKEGTLKESVEVLIEFVRLNTNLIEPEYSVGKQAQVAAERVRHYIDFFDTNNNEN